MDVTDRGLTVVEYLTPSGRLAFLLAYAEAVRARRDGRTVFTGTLRGGY